MKLLIRRICAALAIALPFLIGAAAERACAQGSCAVNTVNGYQPVRYTLRASFIQAGTNTLGSAGPTYSQINYGDPIVKQNITANRPIPQMVLRGAAWRESGWRQFNCGSVAENCTGPTVLSYDCGYGMMQITSCMHAGDPSCGWDRERVAGQLPYNLGVGALFLISKWNTTVWLGSNDHTRPEQWYYAVTAYNGMATSNDPNNTAYDPRRPPFGEGSWSSYLSPRHYTYQEMVYGSAGNPQIASAGAHWLWRPTRIAEVPRGIFGLTTDTQHPWLPPYRTTAPLVWMLPGVHVASGTGPSVAVNNPTSQTLALDVMLYNADGSFRTRWLDPSAEWQYEKVPYIRLSPGQSRVLPLADVLYGATFDGYVRIYASEGLNIWLQPAAGAAATGLGDPPPFTIHMPLVYKPAACTERMLNIGFEEFLDGKPRYWMVSSADGNSNADSTWFQSGHYGAYLGGYDNAADTLTQQVSLPAGTSVFGFNWYMKTAEPGGAGANDTLALRVRNASGGLLATLWVGTNQSAGGAWQTVTLNLSAYAGQTVQIAFESATNDTQPTSFFIDNVSLIGCGG